MNLRQDFTSLDSILNRDSGRGGRMWPRKNKDTERDTDGINGFVRFKVILTM